MVTSRTSVKVLYEHCDRLDKSLDITACINNANFPKTNRE